MKSELGEFLILLRRALLLIDAWWERYPGERYPKAHPYRQAVAMLSSYIEERYVKRSR